MEKILAPSILAADFARLGDEIGAAGRGGAKYIHFDVMDGVFVPNISFGIPVLASARRVTPLTLDVHLMITRPERYIDAFADAGADIITFHPGASDDPAETIRMIRARGVKASLALSPNVPAAEALPYLAELDMVLVMSVEPGFGGQKLIPECLPKAGLLREWADARGLPLVIEMDGGINRVNIRAVIESGVNAAVVGSAVFGPGGAEANARELLEMIG
ncbi:MAG: ribulose-phosphate 3-epimerase [Clostridiales bacterium]|jgi:ribulose-phosphate 3-epimerase|nr:ribulose-phosphate 3-epimerase [Clostridiales bacterium]